MSSLMFPVVRIPFLVKIWERNKGVGGVVTVRGVVVVVQNVVKIELGAGCMWNTYLGR